MRGFIVTISMKGKGQLSERECGERERLEDEEKGQRRWNLSIKQKGRRLSGYNRGNNKCIRDKYSVDEALIFYLLSDLKIILIFILGYNIIF